LQKNEIQISMDGRGRCRDNAKMERFWWALKYAGLKIKDYVSLPHKTPDEVYFGTCNWSKQRLY
jgi:transposase InsO family protein